MKLLIQGLLFGVILEIFTAILRFYFGLEATRDSAIIGNITAGIRIHHGYLGVLITGIAYFIMPGKGNQSNQPATAKHWLLVLGIGLIASDLLHHLLLWSLTGSPQFDLIYPKQ